MSTLGPPILALVTAGGIVALELVTSKYPHTFFVLTPRRSWAFYVYAVVYGIIGLGGTLFLGHFSEAGIVRLEGVGLSSPWVRAIAIGLTVKAFLHIRLFSATVGSQSMPVGVETLVQTFEPWLLKIIELDVFNGVNEFLAPRVALYTDLKDVRERIRSNLPDTLPRPEREALLIDIRQKDRVRDAMRLYLRTVGRTGFEQAFPL